MSEMLPIPILINSIQNKKNFVIKIWVKLYAVNNTSILKFNSTFEN